MTEKMSLKCDVNIKQKPPLKKVASFYYIKVILISYSRNRLLILVT